MKEAYHTAEDFASDPDFRNWVLNPDPRLNYFWENWVKGHPKHEDAIRKARLIVLSFYEGDGNIDNETANQLWQKIEQSTNEIDDKNQQNENHLVVNFPQEHLYSKINRRIKWTASLVAACVGLFIIAYAYISDFQFGVQATTEQSAVPKVITKHVVKGQKLKMFLSDGSIVHLNASSKLKFNEKFSEDKRVVELEGEAFFDIKKDPSRPFIVKCKGLETKVLGTTFNVRSYPDDETTTVALLSGKIQVNNLIQEEEVMLKPGEQANLDNISGKISSGKVTNPLELQWKDGVLAFERQPLHKVFDKLEQWYGVDFKIEGLSCEEKVTGVFKNEYLSNVLQSLRYTVNFEFEIDDDIVYVKK